MIEMYDDDLFTGLEWTFMFANCWNDKESSSG
jgi:hypothetical protein